MAYKRPFDPDQSFESYGKEKYEPPTYETANAPLYPFYPCSLCGALVPCSSEHQRLHDEFHRQLWRERVIRR